ncbi:tRNA (adenosine(37)-N6)-dimethylallyltransferase MiaA [Arsenicitalea aurantiaca]|uniref:tRNA (adenosine(37)-N6)-dimethylallyltransferase MiaA n=1 Tax=Arsenicitalea aurantiaca TaxID=1783274 RepID=UPI003CC7E085
MSGRPARRVVLIAGPTASGKSALALEIARADGGIVVNADAMQVYGVLDRLTARPRPEETGEVPHLLYGHISPAIRHSTGAWLREAIAILEDPALSGRTLVFVGGTGLYFEALTKGIAEIPDVPEPIRAAIEAELAGLDREGREALLLARDPLMAGRIEAADPQRVARALGVLAATGHSLTRFQDAPQAGPLAEGALERIVLDPDRDVLRARIANRFEAMLDAGAIEEVRALLALDLDPRLPAMKAIGVPELAAVLAGTMTLAEATERAIIATRQFAKRQRTWFRNRMGDWPRRPA